MIHVSVDPVLHVAVVAILSAGLIALLFVQAPKSKADGGRRMMLTGLRLAVVLLTLLALLRPEVVYPKLKKQSATLLLMVDRSKSMTVPDSYGGKTRWAAVRDTLDRCQGELADLAMELEVKVYAFDEQIEPMTLAEGKVTLPENPEGPLSAIGACLDDVLGREAGKRLAAVILLSDGAQRALPPRDTSPQTPAARLADWGYPLHAVAFGQASLSQTRDVAVDEFLPVSDTVFVKNELAVTGKIRASGFGNQPMPVELLFETSPGTMEVVARTQVSAGQDGARQSVELSYVPTVPGEFKIALRVPPQEGESVTTNNELATFISVLKGGLNVLYVEGSPLPEQKFIRRSLDGSPNLKVDYLWLNPRAPRARPDELAQLFAPGRYNVIMMGSVHSRTLMAPGEKPGEALALAALKNAVSNGTGLIMLGGVNSFGPGAYADTPLKDVLPVSIDRLESKNPDDPAQPDMHLRGPLAILPTALGESHFLLRLSDDNNANKSAWSALPPLDGANRFRGLSGRGLVLATAPDGKQPLVVAQDFGNGRVIAFAGDSTWKWWMNGHEAEHKRFWRQVILWLAHKDQSTEGNVWVKVDPRRYGPGQRVDFVAGAQSPQGEAVADARFEGEVVMPDGTTRPLRLSKTGVLAAASFLETKAAGDYTVRIRAQKGDQSLGAAQARFLVYDRDLELDNPAADRPQLAALASLTGGKDIAPEQLPALLRAIRKKPMTLEVESETKIRLWDNWPFYVAFTLLLCLEWYLRKRWSLA
jgi:uncharacterized membrane protein